LEAGATCARVDLTWAPIEYHRLSLQNLQEAMRRTRRLCAVMLDSLGREIMVKRKYGVDENGWPGIFEQLRIENEQRVTITTDLDAECTSACLPVTYPKFAAMCQPGDSIFVGRYLVTGADSSSLFLEVEEVTDTDVICVAKNKSVLDGLLTIFHQERSSEGLANLQNDLPALTDFDRQAIQVLTSEFEVDFVSISYCRSVDDITETRDFLESIGASHTKIIAKCETRQSLMNFRSVASASDGIIMSRGNLGLDVQPEKMAMVQKAMCTTCSVLGKPILMTRTCDSMIHTPRPTRAEATDIANAVLDGVDGILLGAETYRGKYGLGTVQTIVAIAREAEAVFDHENHFEHLLIEGEYALSVAQSTGTDDGNDKAGALGLHRTYSHNSLMSEANIGYAFSSANLTSLQRVNSGTTRAPISTAAKLESIAAAAVKTADKVAAKLIIVVTYSGRTAALVAKYRPMQPIMTLVVPYLKRDGLKWVLEGRTSARQALLTYGLMPVLAAPAGSWTTSAGESLVEEAVVMAVSNNIVGPNDHVVVISRNYNDEFLLKVRFFFFALVWLSLPPCVRVKMSHCWVVLSFLRFACLCELFNLVLVMQVVTVDEQGQGIKNIRPKSLIDMLKAAGQIITDDDETEANNGSMRRGTSVLVGSGKDPLVIAPSDLKKNSIPENGVANGI
jgi:pyruvate kinase